MLYYINCVTLGVCGGVGKTQDTEAARSKTTVIIGLLTGNNGAHGGISHYVLFVERDKSLSAELSLQ